MDQGFKVCRKFLKNNVLLELEKILMRHHKNWCESNLDLYHGKAINSAYLTNKVYSTEKDQEFLFQLISSKEIKSELNNIFLKEEACFLNTQLFFDPFDPNVSNYWHRDIQYTGKSLTEQKWVIENQVNNVIHFRIPTREEKGIELIPNTNQRWDTNLELETRLNLNKRLPSEDLPGSKKINLNRGDLLIFSANMIHRGLYGGDRLSLDILYCKPDPEILRYADINCYPKKEELGNYENDLVFKKLYQLKLQGVIE